MTAVIVTGVVSAPIASADNGADLGVPSQAGVAAAVADAVVPAVTVPESPVAVVASMPEYVPPVAQAAEAALQVVSPPQGTDPVVQSEAQQPSPASVGASPTPPPASPAEPSTAAPPAETPVPGARAGGSAIATDPRGGAAAGSESAGDITAAPPATSAQPEPTRPTAAVQLGPVNIQVSIRIASPGDNGDVTQVNAVVTAVAGSAAPVLENHTDHASSGSSSDIGRDITDSTVNSSSDDRTQNSTCGPDHGCRDIPVLTRACLDTGTGALSPEDVACIIDAIFGNASANSGVAVQYQGDAVQYRPINISVSIRISSPGNDGPVVQTNLVHVQASFSVEMGQAAQPLPGPLDVTVGLAPADGDLAPADGGVAEQVPVDGESKSVSDDPGPADIEPSTTDTPSVTVINSPFPLTSGPISRCLVAISRLARGVGRPPSVAWTASIGSPGTARDDTARTAGGKTAQRRPSRAAAPPAPPAHPWVPVAFSAPPAPASSGGGGGGGGGGLAITLSLPFVLAIFYSGLRRLRTSGSVPSAHTDREPERPG